MSTKQRAADLDWSAMGRHLRTSALDAHEGQLPPVDIAYSFLLDNWEIFCNEDDESWEWPADMPQKPNIELIAAYQDAK